MQKKWILFAATLLITTFTVGTVFAVGVIGQSDIEKRLNLLEIALISQSPEQVADTWAKGVMSRNGALQYAVLCKNLQSKYLSDFEASGWSTGTSSPWIENYQISPGQLQNDGTWKFTIKFHYTDSTRAAYSSVSNILIGAKALDNLPLSKQRTEYWCVTEIEIAQSIQKEATARPTKLVCA